MESKLKKERNEICQSENRISQPLEPKSPPQHVLNALHGQIDKAQEEQCLEFTLSTQDAHLIPELLYADANLERRGT